MNKAVQVSFRLERSGKAASNWAPVSLETTDATGNRASVNYGNNGNQARWQGDEGTITYQYGLWPSETAWKLRMEMTQSSNFSSDEEWTATNIPVVQGSQQSFNGVGFGGPRGRGAAPGRGTQPIVTQTGATTPPAAPTPFAEADMGGHHIKVFPAVLFTNQPARPANLPANVVFNQPQQTGLMIQVQPAVMNNGMRINNPNGTQAADDGMRLTVAKVTDSQGGEIQTYGSGWSSSGTGPDSVSTIRITLRDTGDVTNLTATISMHKNRFFEFTVKPEKASADQN